MRREASIQSLEDLPRGYDSSHLFHSINAISVAPSMYLVKPPAPNYPLAERRALPFGKLKSNHSDPSKLPSFLLISSLA